MGKTRKIVKSNKLVRACCCLVGFTLLMGCILTSNATSANDGSVVAQVGVTVPAICTMTGTGMDSHSTEIQNGLYKDNIGTTTLHAFCNDNEGFAIYAAGYTGNEIGAENSNKLVGTNASSNATIVSGIATTASNPDISNWAMKLAISQDSGDTTSTNAFTIDSAPNVDLPSEAEQSTTPASFSEYHVVPNEYVKVAHKNSMTDMTATTGGVKLTTTYAAYISKTQPADTYTGQVIYTLVHPANVVPVTSGQIGVNYHANGSVFPNGKTLNQIIYNKESPVYIATTPQVAKSDNVSSDGERMDSYTTGSSLVPITSPGAYKMKVEIEYGLSRGAGLGVMEGNWDGNSEPPNNYEVLTGPDRGIKTYYFNGDAVTFYMFASVAPDDDDYGYFARVYPVYSEEQPGIETVIEYSGVSAKAGTYVQPNDWLGSWYTEIGGRHYDFVDEVELTAFLNDNLLNLSGIDRIDLYRGLSFAEAYYKAGKVQSGGYYKQQELTKSICQTIAIGQNETVKDVRDNNTYMVGRLKDGNCWMLDNLALDPTDSIVATNMNESNTNATTAAINNFLHGGGGTTGWSSVPVANVSTNFDSFTAPMVNNADKDTLVTSYGPASNNGKAKVGLYYNFCASSIGTYCYEEWQGVALPGTNIDAPQDICPANWRMPTGGPFGEYQVLFDRYDKIQVASDPGGLMYNLSVPLSGAFDGDEGSGRDTYAYMWSSTYSDGIRMFYLIAVGGDDFVNPSFSAASRTLGMTMRCLVGD